ncbi:hypothetical protein [uncultured Methanospirillum sp.]|uniref:hypothetical protein n=1 Tax=uncultured Methanospirillum sp. TaxID=262503 RepID=UPI0029C8E8EE|nr:hypothetical protein [uncultured Methanospirillum sp.]
MYVPVLQGRNSVFTLFILIFLLLSFPVSAVNTGWHPVNITPWAQVDIPPGWTYGDISTDPFDPDITSLVAKSPDGSTTLQYLFDHNPNQATPGDLMRAQDQYMNKQGFCLCQDRPSFTENDGNTAMKQTYIKGTEDGAVVCSGAYPGWGRYQYALLMNGASSVSKYFDDLPDDVADHIRPVNVGYANSTNTTVIHDI